MAESIKFTFSFNTKYRASKKFPVCSDLKLQAPGEVMNSLFFATNVVLQ